MIDLLIVNGTTAYNTDHLVEMTVDDADNVWGLFHTGSEHGFYERRIYSGMHTVDAFEKIVAAIERGDKVCRLDEE